MGLIYFILFIVMVVALIWPSKVLSFVNVSNGWRRVIAVVGWFAICTLLSPLDGVINKHNNDIAQEEAELSGVSNVEPVADSESFAGLSTSSSVYERLKSDSALLMEEDIFNPADIETAYALGVKWGMLTALASKDRYSDRNPIDSLETTLLEKNIKTANKLITKLQPIFRKQFVTILKNTLWEHNIEVQARNNYKIITFTGGTFANNANIKQFQSEAYDMLKQLGFTRAEYKWYKYDDEYTYYTIN